MPEVLPGGKSVLFVMLDEDALSSGSLDDSKIALLSLDTGERKVIFRGGAGARYGSGHIVYVRGGALYAVPFDDVNLELAGDPAVILERISWNSGSESSHFAVSREGTLAYFSGGTVGEVKAHPYSSDTGGRERRGRSASKGRVQPSSRVLVSRRQDAGLSGRTSGDRTRPLGPYTGRGPANAASRLSLRRGLRQGVTRRPVAGLRFQ